MSNETNNDLMIGFKAGVDSVAASSAIEIANVQQQAATDIAELVGQLDTMADDAFISETRIQDLVLMGIAKDDAMNVFAEGVYAETARQVNKATKTSRANTKAANETIKKRDAKIEADRIEAVRESLRMNTRNVYSATAIKQANLMGLEKDKTIEFQREIINKFLDIFGEDFIKSSDMGTLTKMFNKIGL